MLAIVTNHHGPQIHARHGVYTTTLPYNTVLSAQANAIKAARSLANEREWGQMVAIGFLDEGVYVCIFPGKTENT